MLAATPGARAQPAPGAALLEALPQAQQGGSEADMLKIELQTVNEATLAKLAALRGRQQQVTPLPG